MNRSIYLDYAATTPVDPQVAEKMLQYLSPTEFFGNPASSHSFGKAAKDAIELARTQVAALINAEPREIIWTSGATEANNLALKGIAQLYKSRGKHIITLTTEHPSVLDCCQQLEKQGYLITYLTPEKNGLLDSEKFHSALRADTIVVSIMHVNNETGTIQDIKKIAEITSKRGIFLHVDAAQSAGKIPIDVQQIPVDLLSLCAHKIYGPKGIGALYVRQKPRVRVAAQMHGGGHELGMRSGTLATHQIAGMGEAFAIAAATMRLEQNKIRSLKDQFWQGIHHLPVSQNSDPLHTIPTILNLHLHGIKATQLIKDLPTLAISAGSACHAKGDEPSYVLRALGFSEEQARCSVRFSFGRFTTPAEIDAAIKALQQRII